MTIRELTRIGTNPRKIARLLQAKAPEGHILAYITPEEADVLKARGGSGRPHEDTGIPSFQDETFDMDQPGAGGTVAEQQGISGGGITPDVGAGYQLSAAPTEFGLQPSTAANRGEGITAPAGFGYDVTAQVPPSPRYGLDAAGRAVSEAATAQPAAQPAAQPKDQSFLKQLGLGLAQGLPAALLARRAGQQAGAAKTEMQSIAQPYQQLGQNLQAQAQRGELTPAGQQSLQAVQARLAQGAEARGGVGAQQSAAQLEAFRQQLLQQQFDYGLKLANIGDQISIGAIRTGIQADQYANSLTNTFMSNLMKGMSAPGQITPGG